MEWTGYLLGFMAGLAVLGIFALQVLHAVAEYHDRAVAFNALPNKRLIDQGPCQAVELRIRALSEV
ncbi:MAG TPA: hypothetical protein HPP81_06305 [Deltaproteobacteria bacterium]|jgi:hypothetical protein|nr:hypothetical protein [Deltaproteobacteria bacterium]